MRILDIYDINGDSNMKHDAIIAFDSSIVRVITEKKQSIYKKIMRYLGMQMQFQKKKKN